MSTLTITKENFNSEVANAKGTVLIDFFASWCGPCRMVAPIIDEIASEETEVKVCKVDVDDQPELANAFGVASIPTIVVIKDGKVAERATGARSKKAIKTMLKG